MIHALGYTALAVSLFAMAMNSIWLLRTFHIVASVLYGIYGFLIDSTPLIIGAMLFVGIHCFHLIRKAGSA